MALQERKKAAAEAAATALAAKKARVTEGFVEALGAYTKDGLYRIVARKKYSRGDHGPFTRGDEIPLTVGEANRAFQPGELEFVE